jgi:hypothetical protein
VPPAQMLTRIVTRGPARIDRPSTIAPVALMARRDLEARRSRGLQPVALVGAGLLRPRRTTGSRRRDRGLLTSAGAARQLAPLDERW